MDSITSYHLCFNSVPIAPELAVNFFSYVDPQTLVASRSVSKLWQLFLDAYVITPPVIARLSEPIRKFENGCIQEQPFMITEANALNSETIVKFIPKISACSPDYYFITQQRESLSGTKEYVIVLKKNKTEKFNFEGSLHFPNIKLRKRVEIVALRASLQVDHCAVLHKSRDGYILQKLNIEVTLTQQKELIRTLVCSINYISSDQQILFDIYKDQICYAKKLKTDDFSYEFFLNDNENACLVFNKEIHQLKISEDTSQLILLTDKLEFFSLENSPFVPAFSCSWKGHKNDSFTILNQWVFSFSETEMVLHAYQTETEKHQTVSLQDEYLISMQTQPPFIFLVMHNHKENYLHCFSTTDDAIFTVITPQLPKEFYSAPREYANLLSSGQHFMFLAYHKYLITSLVPKSSIQTVQVTEENENKKLQILEKKKLNLFAMFKNLRKK